MLARLKTDLAALCALFVRVTAATMERANIDEKHSAEL